MERRVLEDDDEVGGNIKTMVSFVVERIVKEDTDPSEEPVYEEL